MMEVRDIMTKSVIAIAPDMVNSEAADLLMRYRIHGAPMFDEGDQLIGMITFMDLAGRPGEKVRDVGRIFGSAGT